MAKKRKTTVSGKPAGTKGSAGKQSTRKKSAAREKKKRTGSRESSPSTASGADFAVVGLGASAGGLDAFRQFFTATPDDTGMAFVLIQHLDPTHESLTAELLDRHTGMTVVQVTDEMHVEPNHVYVIPPNRYLTISGETLHLTEPVQRRGLRVPIDFFLRSLAEDQQARAIGIILSGTGSDGTLGAREIKAAGGMVMVQTPENAQYDGMPRSTMGTGVVDFVVPVEKMPETLIRYVQHWYVNGTAAPAPAADAVPDHLTTILGILRARLKYDFSCYKKGTLTRRIQRRMGLMHVHDIDEYVEMLRQEKGEVNALYKDLLIGVTNFFREPEAWQAMKQHVIEPLVAGIEASQSSDGIRVWTPGCATGEEPYSIAMLINETMQQADAGCDVNIFASDIDIDALALARAGVYPETIAVDVTPDRLRRFFIKGEHTYRINKDIREDVVFAEQNLISDPPFSKLDLISCRNLLIYLEPEIQNKILSMFHFALRQGGCLFLGNAETINQQQQLFQPISRKWRIFRRVGPVRPGPARPERIDVPTPAAETTPKTVLTTTEIPDLRTRHLSALAQQHLIRRFAPASVVVNPNGEILYLTGPVDEYLRLPTGEPTLDLLATARPGLRTKLRAALNKAIREGKPLTLEDARVKRGKQHFPICVTIEPLSQAAEAEGLLLLVAFDEAVNEDRVRVVYVEPPEHEITDKPATTEEYESVIRHLEGELTNAREDLQTTVEELETSNEEFKAANEEVTSVNEELQSTNEELETSKEELQSMNEELQTVNSQLEAKVGELESTNNDMSNLLTSIDQATLFLDRSFQIRRFTPATTRLLRVIDTDIGRPFRDFAQNFSDEDLMSDAQRVLAQLTPIEKEVTDSAGRWYLRRIVPYRTEDNRIDGVVITLTDITARKQATDAINEARLYAEGIVQTVREPLLVLDADFRVQSANPSFYRAFHTQPKGTKGRLLYELGNGQWDIPQLHQLLDDVLSGGERVADLEVTHTFEGIGPRTMLFNARAIQREGERPDQILLAIEDITSRRRADEQLAALNESLEQQVSERVAELELAAQDQAFLAALVESSSAAIVSSRSDGAITHWNASAQQLFGYSSDEVLGQNVRMLCPPERQAEFDEIKDRLLRNEMVRGLETIRLHRDGTRIHVSMTVSLIQNSQPLQLCGIITDTRERKRMEESLAEVAENERRSLGRDLHDTLAQQITGVGMLTASLRDELPLGSSADDLIEKLESNVQRMQKQVRTIANGLLPVDLDGGGLPAALERLASETTDIFQVPCEFIFLDDVPLSDSFIATQLFMIAREATHNAAKHAQAGEITLRLTDHDGIHVTITDDGVGMPPRVRESSGMGLPIMRHRAGLIGAELHYESPSKGGTIVHCFLPLRKDAVRK